MAEDKTPSTTPQEDQDDPPKHPGGRPLKYETVEELDQAIRAYFDLCDPHIEDRVVDAGVNQRGETIWQKREVMTEQKPYLMTGLARALGVDRKTLKNYGKRDQFFPTVNDARSRCEEYAEGQLFGPYNRGAAFNLDNNYEDWRNRQELTGKDGEDLGKGWADMVAQAAKVAQDAETDASAS